MEKKNIAVLVNTSVGYDGYIAFLCEKYNVKVIDAKDYKGERLDLLLFTGGEDVTPALYEENKGKYTGTNKDRDIFESDYMFRRFPKVPKLGICRGSQFLTVMSGGSLIQHVSGHATGKLHEIVFKKPYSGKIYSITSTHHQMMYPYTLDKAKYQIIATSKFFQSNTYLDGRDQEKALPKNFEECEMVYYPDTLSFCIQGHPEMKNCPQETKDLCLNLIDNILNP